MAAARTLLVLPLLAGCAAKPLGPQRLASRAQPTSCATAPIDSFEPVYESKDVAEQPALRSFPPLRYPVP